MANEQHDGHGTGARSSLPLTQARDAFAQIERSMMTLESLFGAQSGGKYKTAVNTALEVVLELNKIRYNLFPESEAFNEGEWNMLLNLRQAHSQDEELSVKALCIGSNFPATTSLRYIGLLLDRDLIRRTRDDEDKRRVFVHLTPHGLRTVDKYLALAANCLDKLRLQY